MRKWIYVAAACMGAAAMANAQSVTGRWTGPGALTRTGSVADNGTELVLALDQSSGGAITGWIAGPRANDQIVSGKLEGNNLTLEAERAGRGGQIQKVTYTAVIEGGKMKLTMPQPQFGGRGRGRAGAAPPPRPPQIFELARVSTKDPGARPAPAPMVSLPMPEPVQHQLARTPPMGWNSWNKFTNQVSDAMVREMADAIVSYRHARRRLRLRQHRRHLGRPASRLPRQHHHQQQIPRHEEAVRLHPQQGAEARHLFFARSQDLRRLHGQLPA